MNLPQPPPKKEELPLYVPNNELGEMILKVYEKYDHSGKHNVDIRDIPYLVRSLGCCPTEKEMVEIINNTKNKEEVDSHNCPAIYFIPYMCEAMTNHKYYPSNAEQLLTAFRYFDTEGRGYLTKAQFAKIMTEDGEPFEEDEFQDIMHTALDPVTDIIPYEYYVNQLLIVPLDIYNVADKLEAERRRKEEEEMAKKRKLFERNFM